MSKDTIYREDAIKEIKEYMVKENEAISEHLDDIFKYNSGLLTAIQAVHDLPSADRPQGEWIFKTIFPNDKSEFPVGYLVCSVCGSYHSNSTPCNYCDNCGADMRKGADDEMRTL